MNSTAGENRLTIVGYLGNRPETRHTPAGIPITRFTLRHRSVQTEAGMQREAVCSIGVIASGEALQATLRGLSQESVVRVSGFISRANNRQGEYRIVLHAEQIEPLGDG